MIKRANKMKETPSSIAGKIFIYGSLIIFSILIIVPFWMVIVKSFMSDKDIMNNPLSLWPENFQFSGYETIFTNKMYDFGRAFLNSVYITLVGTVYQLAITTLTAYALSKKHLRGKKIIMLYFVFTMYFSGGTIPYYLVVNSLNLTGKLEVMYIPAFMGIFNMLVMRAYFIGLPQDLEEAARIDGLGNFGIFIKIVLPLSTAILATIALFISVGLWNNWYTSMLFMLPHDKRPMAYALQVIIEHSRGSSGENSAGVTTPIGQSIQYAGIVVSIVPIMCVYPFLQKHFTKGVLVGSVKG